MMTQPSSYYVGGSPDPFSRETMRNTVSLLKDRLSPLLDLTQPIVYYVGPAGSDANNGLSEGNAFATLAAAHDAINAVGGGCLILLKNGSVFRGKGKDFEWLASDGGHRAALYCTQDNVYIGTYGTGDGPIFICGDNWLPAATTTWTQDGTHTGAWWADTSGLTDSQFDWLFEDGDELNRFAQAASVADCSTTSRSFYLDAAADRMYVNVGGDPSSNAGDLTLISRNNLSCFRMEGDNNVVWLEGSKGTRAVAYGWGFDATDTNSHDYFMSAGQAGSEYGLYGGVEIFYGSTHLAGTWFPGASGASGGIVTFVDISGGLNIDTTEATRVVNCYMPGGGQEAVCVNVEATETDLSGGKVDAVGGHTSGGASALCLIYWGCGESSFSDTADLLAVRLMCFQNTKSSPGGINLSPGAMTPINERVYGAGTTGAATAADFDGDWINPYLHMSSAISSGNRCALVNRANPLSNTANVYYGTHEGLLTQSQNLGIGFDFDVLTSDDTLSNITLHNTLIQRDPDSASTSRMCVGAGDNADRQKSCAYRNVSASTRNQSGYDNIVDPIEPTADSVFGETAAAELIGAGDPTIGGPDYDVNFAPRDPVSPTIGPTETSVAPTLADLPASIRWLGSNITDQQKYGVNELALPLAGAGLNPQELKPGMRDLTGNLKRGLVNESYSGGAASIDQLKQGLIDGSALKSGLLNPDGSVKSGIVEN